MSIDTNKWRTCAPLLPDGGCEAVQILCDEIDRVRSERDTLHALLCVVDLMDNDDTTGTVKVYRDSMPSPRALFKDGENAMTLSTATARAMELLATTRPSKGDAP